MAHIKYTKELLEEAVKGCNTFSELSRKLGLNPVGGSFKTLKSNLVKFEVDTSFFRGKGWRKGSDKPVREGYKLEDILEGKHPTYKSSKLKPRLIAAKIFEEKCSNCLLSEWLGGKIPLELDHISGDSSDNRLSNLRLLCPNCHALTFTYRGRNKK